MNKKVFRPILYPIGLLIFVVGAIIVSCIYFETMYLYSIAIIVLSFIAMLFSLFVLTCFIEIRDDSIVFRIWLKKHIKVFEKNGTNIFKRKRVLYDDIASIYFSTDKSQVWINKKNGEYYCIPLIPFNKRKVLIKCLEEIQMTILQKS